MANQCQTISLQSQADFLQLMMNAHEPTADKIDVEDDKIGGMKWDEVTTKGYKGKIKFTNVINYSTNNISATVCL